MNGIKKDFARSINDLVVPVDVIIEACHPTTVAIIRSDKMRDKYYSDILKYLRGLPMNLFGQKERGSRIVRPAL